MEISDDLLCVFSATVEARGDSYTLEIPKQEIATGAIQTGAVYRTAILSHSTAADAEAHSSPSGTGAKHKVERKQDTSEPPIAEGEVREVEIEDIGEQGDGITRVERGFVVIIPETEQGERVTVEITDVQPNVAFGEVKDRQTHLE